jgi:basic amino acid/polyamine antiporter, APA family
MSIKLKKELNLLDVIFATIGIVIGAGIYSIIGIASKYAKNFTWISVILCSIFAICTGLSYAELGSIFNKNGGEYNIAKEVFNADIAKFVGILIIIGEILLITTVSFGLGSYLSTFIPLKIPILAGILQLFFSYLNYSGIRNSINFNNIATIIEICGLLFVGLLGIFNINTNIFDISKINTKTFFNIIIASSFLYFAYFGFDILIELIEETKESEKNIPKGLIYGVIISSILYLLVTISAISSIGWKKLSESKSPIIDITDKLLNNKMGFIMMGIAIISMSNTLLMSSIGTSRFIQSVAKDINLPFGLDKIDQNNHTPKNAIIFITIISMLGLLFKNIENSAAIANFFTIILFLIVNIAVILLRIKDPERNRPFKIPFNIYDIPITSIIGTLSSILFIFTLIKHKLF